MELVEPLLPGGDDTTSVDVDSADDGRLLLQAWLTTIGALAALVIAWTLASGFRTWITDYHLAPMALRDVVARGVLVGVAAAPGLLALRSSVRALRRGIRSAATPAAIAVLVTAFWVVTYALDVLRARGI